MPEFFFGLFLFACGVCVGIAFAYCIRDAAILASPTSSREEIHRDRLATVPYEQPVERRPEWYLDHQHRERSAWDPSQIPEGAEVLFTKEGMFEAKAKQ